jgi:hypothetical protein
MLRIHGVCFVQRVAFLYEANDADKELCFVRPASCIVLHIQCVSRCIFSHKILFLFLRFDKLFSACLPFQKNGVIMSVCMRVCVEVLNRPTCFMKFGMNILSLEAS